jgi:hypothetical protein
MVSVVLALPLAGCAGTLKLVADTFGVDVVPENVQQKAYKAASVSFTAWEAVQDGVLRYGKLPPCDATHKILCRNEEAWQKIKEIEKKTSDTLVSTKPIIEAGTDDVQLLMAIPAVVYDAQAAIEGAKGAKQ